MLTGTLARCSLFARTMDPSIPAVDRALPALRTLLRAAAVPFRWVGGIAVVHHGYARTTVDIDVLVAADALERIEPHLSEHGFEKTSHGLRHLQTGVSVDFLIEGRSLPRAGAGVYPAPDAMPGAEDDPDVLALAPLIALKLRAARHQDLADVVALLKRLDEGGYLSVESSIDPALRSRLLELRRDALEELAWER